MVRLPPATPARAAWPHSPRLARAHAAHASLRRKPGVGGGSLQIRSAALCCAMLARALAGDGVRLSRGLRFVATCRPRVIRPGCVVPPHLPAVRPPRHHRRRLVIHFGSRELRSRIVVDSGHEKGKRGKKSGLNPSTLWASHGKSIYTASVDSTVRRSAGDPRHH